MTRHGAETPFNPELLPDLDAKKSSLRLLTFLREHQRWQIVALLFLIAAVNNLDRQALSVLAPSLRENLGFGAIEYSYIVTSFLAAYTLGYTFCGAILDRVGVKIGLAVALAFWSLSGMLHAVATGWITLAVFRFMLGIGESFNSPGGVKAISEWIPPRERGLSMAVFSNGNVIGAILAPPIVAILALHFGWRWAFIGTGAIGFILLLIWWRRYESPERQTALTAKERAYLQDTLPAEPEEKTRIPMLALLRDPLCVAFFLGRFLTDSSTYFFSFWLPDYLTHSRGFSLALIGLIGWLPFLASDVGGPGGGALSDWLVRRGWKSRKARLTMMFSAACLMPMASVAVRVESAMGALALIALILAAQSCWMANQLTLISESVSRQNVATLLSLSALGGGLGGIISTLVAGRVISSFGYIPVFTGIGLLHLTAFATIFFLIRWKNSGSASPR